jgi:hypothetical protein
MISFDHQGRHLVRPSGQTLQISGRRPVRPRWVRAPTEGGPGRRLPDPTGGQVEFTGRPPHHPPARIARGDRPRSTNLRPLSIVETFFTSAEPTTTRSPSSRPSPHEPRHPEQHLNTPNHGRRRPHRASMVRTTRPRSHQLPTGHSSKNCCRAPEPPHHVSVDGLYQRGADR